MARMLVLVLFLAVGAFAMPQKDVAPAAPEAPAPAPEAAEAPKPKVPVVEEPITAVELPEANVETPEEKPEPKVPVVEEPITAVELPEENVETPEEKPEPKVEEPKVEEPKVEEPKVEEPKAEPKPEIIPAPNSTEKTCVEQSRKCLEGANWSYTKIANCTWQAGVCLAGRLGIQY